MIQSSFERKIEATTHDAFHCGSRPGFPRFRVFALIRIHADGDQMAVAEKPIESSMSVKAWDLITCYYDGIDNIVRDLAEQVALQQGSLLDDGSTVAVEVEHVREAGRLVIDGLRELVKAGKAPPALSKSIDRMEKSANQRFTKEGC